MRGLFTGHQQVMRPPSMGTILRSARWLPGENLI